MKALEFYSGIGGECAPARMPLALHGACCRAGEQGGLALRRVSIAVVTKLGTDAKGSLCPGPGAGRLGASGAGWEAQPH